MQTLKKTIFIVITAVLLLLLMGVPTVFAEVGDIGMDGDFDWEETDEDAVTITAYTGVGGSVTIPATLSGKTVTAISDTAFKYEEGVVEHAADVTEIIIQAPITSIAEGSFTECTKLESVIFGVSSVTEIGANAFSGTALTSIKIPASVTTIGANAFNPCPELASLTFETGSTGSMLTEIGESAFSGTKLTSVRIPANVETIGNNAFSDCAGLASLTFASKYSVTSIGDNAFSGTKLEYITIPESIETIGAGAFADCEELTKVIINNTDVVIGAGAFEFSDKLTIYAPKSSSVYDFCDDNDPNIHFTPLEYTVGDTSITSVVSSGSSRITITWSEADRATEYQVWRANTQGGVFSLIATTSEKSYTNTGLTVSVTYYYKVRGISTDEGKTFYGNFTEPIAATPMPGAPNSVYAVSEGYNSIKISWTPVPSASGYEIWRANDKIDNAYSLIKTLPRSTSITAVQPNSYKFTSLTPARKYFYKIRAYINVVNPTTKATTKCYGLFSGITMARPTPAAVTNLVATPYSPTSIKLSWKSVAGRTRYEIWRKGPDDDKFVLYPSTTSYTYFTNDKGIVVDSEYSYQVRAYRTSAYGDNGRIYGGFSNIATATPYVKQVTGLDARRYSNTKIKITWRSLTGVDGYELQWAESPDAADEEWTTIYTGTSRSRYHSGLTDNKPYYYRVRAYERTTISEDYPDGKSYGEWSKVDGATP